MPLKNGAETLREFININHELVNSHTIFIIHLSLPGPDTHHRSFLSLVDKAIYRYLCWIPIVDCIMTASISEEQYLLPASYPEHMVTIHSLITKGTQNKCPVSDCVY